MGLMDKFKDPSLFDSLSFGDKMLGSTVTMIMGIGVTFCILILLWLLIAVMGKIMSSGKKKNKNAEETGAAAAAPVTAAETTAAAVTDDNADVIAAVIAAAVAAYEGSGAAGNLVVRKISRISGEITPWSNAAREDCIESRKF